MHSSCSCTVDRVVTQSSYGRTEPSGRPASQPASCPAVAGDRRNSGGVAMRVVRCESQNPELGKVACCSRRRRRRLRVRCHAHSTSMLLRGRVRSFVRCRDSARIHYLKRLVSDTESFQKQNPPQPNCGARIFHAVSMARPPLARTGRGAAAAADLPLVLHRPATTIAYLTSNDTVHAFSVCVFNICGVCANGVTC